MSDSKTPPAAETTEPQGSAFGWRFWNCNIIEMWERLAYYTLRPIAPIYIAQASDPGGLHLTQETKGWIYMWWAIFQSFLPMFTGGYADRYGYKKTLFFSITLNMIGYLMMAFMHSYYGFFSGIIVLAIGTAFFKPSLQATLAHNLNKANASVGWGIFYMVVNFGSVIGHYISPFLLGAHDVEGWRTMFLACAGFTAMNYILLFTYKDVPSGASKKENPIQVFSRTIANVWPFWFIDGRLHPIRGPLGIAGAIIGLALIVMSKSYASGNMASAGIALLLGGVLLATWLRGGVFTWQVRLPIWLLIMSCFWLVMYQLWDLQPNFIEDWVDSSMVAQHIPIDSFREYSDRGQVRVAQQVLLSLNALLIVFLMVPISWSVRKLPTLSAMFMGMLVVTAGLILAGLTGNGWILLLGILLFSLGEMLVGPKKNEYLGLIAPPGKKGLYLGYVNIPVGVGVGIGSMIAGIVYGSYGEKATLCLKEMGQRPALLARAAHGSDWSDALGRIPDLLDATRDQIFTYAADSLEMPPQEAAATLQQVFRYDKGQIINLGLIHLAQEEAYRERVAEGVAGELRALADRLAETPDDADVDLPPATQAATAPTTQAGDDVTPASLRALADRIEGGEVAPAVDVLARYVHKLTDWTGVQRVEVLIDVRQRTNAGRADPLDVAQIIERLWGDYGANAEVVNNLALEYVAQETYRVRDAVEELEIDDPTEDIPAKLGIGRTKAFDAITVGMGVPLDELEQTLIDENIPGRTFVDKFYVYLIRQDHVRIKAIELHDWRYDAALLEELIGDDEQALAAAREAAGRDVTVDDISQDKALVKAALGAKDWAAAPDQIPALLRLNPSEARAQAAAEINRAGQRATQMLWEKYDPQYHVWVPFAVIGVIASIALGVFGQMAKRWKDMNA